MCIYNNVGDSYFFYLPVYNLFSTYLKSFHRLFLKINAENATKVCRFHLDLLPILSAHLSLLEAAHFTLNKTAHCVFVYRFTLHMMYF